MSLLELFFVISGGVIILFSFQIARRERFNALHFLVFLGWGAGLLIFTLIPATRQWIAHLFGIERGAEVLVYASIIFLTYFVLLLLKKTEANREEISRLVRALAVEKAKHAKK